MLGQTLLGPVLRDEDHLEALRRTRLLDTPPEEAFVRLTRLVCRLLSVPTALVSLVEADRQFLKSATGLPQPWLLRRRTSLLHSFCQHVVATGAPLVIQDAGQHSVLSDNRAVSDLGVVAYLGMPLIAADGRIFGAVCAIGPEPRTWTTEDAAALRDLAAVTMSEVTLQRLSLEMQERAAEVDAAHKAILAREHRLEALRQLADGIAHDLAGVMQAVQSGMRLASTRLGHNPASVQSILALIDDVARRGGDLTARLLAFAPRGELRPEWVNVALPIQQVGRVLANIPGTPLRVQMDVDPHLPLVLADLEELKAVLLGLAAAARDAMPEGGTLTLGAAVDEIAPGPGHPARLQPGRYIRLSVADTGTGLGGEGQAEAKNSSSTAGLPSLGTQFELALVRNFAEQAGGGLAWENRPGIGSTIALWVPVVEVAEPADCRRSGGARS
ncbi:GAF domain-containing protein [Dankookia sp. GCM10030260]|uniref:GAF domain-containing protein n=1 Tax=Dankookia sp. GCM10030260 TaxID=3273390 RepID=UPI0036082011